jgi:Protein of unknown function (DUF3592)
MTWELAFCLLFLGVGAGSIVYSVLALVSALESRRWPEAAGVMTESRLEKSRGYEGGYTYRPVVSYRFTVEGKELVGGRACFGDRIGTNWSSPAKRILRKYPHGAQVKVRYNPRRPEDAVLEPGLNGFIVSFFLLGVAFFVFGLLGLRLAL